MSDFMEILKRHAFLIVCAAVGVFGLALTGWGMMKMADVKTELQKAVNLANSLDSAARKPSGSETVINSKAIENETRKIEQIKENHEQVLKLVRDLQPGLDPESGQPRQLIPGLFPSNSAIGPKREFKDAYPKAFEEFLRQLKAGSPPTLRSIDDAKTQIALEREVGDIGVNASQLEKPDANADVEQYKEHGPVTPIGARLNPQIRASIANAHDLYCYATTQSFTMNDKVLSAPIAPELYDMWDAQVTLWIQQDIVAALAHINDAEAEKLKAAGQEPWVGVLPVKELVGIGFPPGISPPYVLAGDLPVADVPKPDEPKPWPPASPSAVFTQQASNNLFEVVQFTVHLVVDFRALPSIIAELGHDRSNTVLRVSYHPVPQNLQLVDKVYGPAPVVDVVLDMETHMFGDVYRDLMPDDVREATKLPPREKDKQKT